MIRSMTGFGRCETEENNRRVTVEMRSVNNRYLDLSVKMPRKFGAFEAAVRAEVKKYLDENGVRVEVDTRSEKIGRKIRDNEMQHIPYLLVVGQKEAESGTVSVRKQGQGDTGSIKYQDFAKKIVEEVRKMTEKC